jgi:S-disulfanyl-L-cysteine oxidoreductase SoxD
MSSFPSRILALGGLVLMATLCSAQPARFEGVGRTATPAEVQAWDIDVRPDFKGLPAGQGSVKRGEQVWEAQCASCHGTFGESNDVFTPIVGFTSKKDIETGQVASLQLGANAPTRTTMMKVAYVSTLWDYINRAMPWTAPKSLSADDVYAVTAFILNLSSVVPDDFTLSDKNIREVQNRLPNRRGLTTAHGLWPDTELGSKPRPDTQGSACMRDCQTDVRVTSLIPEYARNAHGNLAEQSRGLGATRGADTSEARKPGAKVASTAPAPAPAAPPNSGASAAAPNTTEVMPLLQKGVCIACHGVDAKLVGPSFKDIAAKYQGRSDAQAYLTGKIRAGGQGVWGSIPMPAQSIAEADAQRLAHWLAAGSVK